MCGPAPHTDCIRTERALQLVDMPVRTYMSITCRDLLCTIGVIEANSNLRYLAITTQQTFHTSRRAKWGSGCMHHMSLM